MPILSEEQHRILAFIAACNRNHYTPTAAEVTLWNDNPTPRAAEYRYVSRQQSNPAGAVAANASYRMITAAMVPSFAEYVSANLGRALAPLAASLAQMSPGERELVSPAETMLGHLLRLTWLEEVPATGGREAGLRLTGLGQALLREAENETDADEDVSVVVLGADDPLAYPLLLGRLTAAGAGMLVDPYLKLEDLHRLTELTQLTRLLVTGKRNDSVLSSLATYLDNPRLQRRLVVRASTQLHDRLLLADDGEVLTLGTSLNGVGKTATVMTPMPEAARDSLREHYERLWNEAALVGPPENDEDKDVDEEASDDPS